MKRKPLCCLSLSREWLNWKLVSRLWAATERNLGKAGLAGECMSRLFSINRMKASLSKLQDAGLLWWQSFHWLKILHICLSGWKKKGKEEPRLLLEYLLSTPQLESELASKAVTCCPSQVTMAGKAENHLEEGVWALVIKQQSGSPGEQMEIRCRKDWDEVEWKVVAVTLWQYFSNVSTGLVFWQSVSQGALFLSMSSCCAEKEDSLEKLH